MRAWQYFVIAGCCSALLMTGCAKKESTFEKAGKEMDNTLRDMDHQMDKTFKK